MTQPPLPSEEALTPDSPAVLAKPHRRASWSRTQWAWFVLISAAYLLRLILMPVTGQNDLVLPAWKAHYINQGQWNIYAYMAEVYRDAETDHPPAAYPYGFYATTAAWLEALRRVNLIDLDEWDKPWNLSNRALSFFLLKLPYLACDLLIGLLLARAARPARGLLAWAVWAWSPSAVYLLLMGQNDLYIALFMALAACLGMRALEAQQGASSSHRPAALAIASMATLGVGATFKIAPLFLVIPFALTLASRWRDRLLLIAIPLILFGASAAPFLTTPAFVNGVLFNWEGVRAFSAVQIFAAPVSLFVMAYVALLVFLLARAGGSARPADVWWIGAAVFSIFFLFSWSQFYWAIWLTPFVAAPIAIDAGRQRYWGVLWLILEIAFAVLLFSLHRDFNLGLLAAGSLSFRFAQFDAALALFAPALRQPVDILWTSMRSAQTAARLLTLAGAFGLLTAPWLRLKMRAVHADLQPILLQRWVVALLLPMSAGLIAAGGMLALSQNAAAREYLGSRIAQRAVLSADQPVFTQTLPATSGVLTGLLLNILPGESAALPATLRACVSTPDGEQCSQGELIRSNAFNGYGFRFLPPLITDDQMLQIAFHLALPAPGARVVAPIASPVGAPHPEEYRWQQGEILLTGHLNRLAALRPFGVGQALSELGSRISEDWRLAIVWLLVVFACLFIINRAIGRLHDGALLKSDNMR